MSAVYLAPAKLNLFLHITGRRPDGYHLLQSLFVPIDWCDVLRFALRTDSQVVRVDGINTTGEALPAVDLSVRAAQMLKDFAGQPDAGCTIHLEKRIPSQAGLGGGSSDAATTLMALNALWGLGLDVDALSSLGLRLGADVPFFLHQRPCWVEGVGEQIWALAGPEAAALPERYLVVKPLVGVMTAALFAARGLPRQAEPLSRAATICSFVAQGLSLQPPKQPRPLRNDLQAVAQELNPQITQAFKWLCDLGLEGRMTGSGSAVFAPVDRDFVLTAQSLCGLPKGFTHRLCNRMI